MKTSSEHLRNNVIALLNNGLSSRKIAAQLHVSHTTVDRIRSTFCPETQICHRWRPEKLTTIDKRRLARAITSGKADTTAQLTREFQDTSGVSVGADTMRRALK